ncbi:hypothetical protein [Methanobrevibacter sp.]|uniref:hypothetical protein n=1 Tax=Methanobrevibacter sp. TaxID=66852 RepID=UPI00388DD1ED
MYSKLDNQGNLITGTTVILVVSLILIVIFIINSINYMESENIDSIENDNVKYIIEDYKRNLEQLGRESIAEETEKLYHAHTIHDSRKEIKKIMNNKLKDVNLEYKKKYGIDIRSEVTSVESTDSPWKVLFKVRVKADKDSHQYNGIIESNSSIEGLKDPLPYAKLPKLRYNIQHEWDTIFYFQALSQYLRSNGIDGYEAYVGATAPLTIKKCPYDPYIHHGDGNTMNDCLKKGYFHESADGSCYLCRLDGKGVCPHYGMEVFIQTYIPWKNESVSCSDHVVFNDHYPGEKLNKLSPTSLILDDSHAKKYGLVRDG